MHSILQPAFNLTAWKICSVKQALAVDSSVKVKVFKWAWLRWRQFGTFVTTSLSLLSFDSFGFVAISSVLDKESFDLKVLANQ